MQDAWMFKTHGENKDITMLDYLASCLLMGNQNELAINAYKDSSFGTLEREQLA